MPSCLAPPQTPPTLPMSAQDTPHSKHSSAACRIRVGDRGGSELIKVYPVLSKTGAQISAKVTLSKQLPYPHGRSAGVRGSWLVAIYKKTSERLVQAPSWGARTW